MKKVDQIIIELILLVFVTTSHFVASAQQLPARQTASLFATGVKIDGKNTEWGTLQAYNKANAISYTIANDNDNLYLVVFINEYINLDKLLYGGITFTISDPANNKASASVTYPTINYNKNFPMARSVYNYYNDFKKDIIANKSKIDSLMRTLNTRSITTFNEIQLADIKDISEPIISIYNTTGIKAALAFDNNIALTYEMAIPLKLLAGIINNGSLNYNIKLNGRVVEQTPGAPAGPRPANGGGNGNALYLDSATDFGGEYTLAKKP